MTQGEWHGVLVVKVRLSRMHTIQSVNLRRCTRTRILWLQIHIQPALLPHKIRSLLVLPAAALLRNLNIEIPQNTCQDETHLSVSEANRSVSKRPTLEKVGRYSLQPNAAARAV